MKQYSKTIYPYNFVQDETTKKFVVSISAASLDFSASPYFSVIKVLRKEDNNAPWRNVIFQYEIDNAGDLKLIFDEQFTGRVSVITDT